MAATSDASPAPPAKRSVYAEAVDPAKYRVADEILFTCAAHSSAAVLCATAGKTGRNGRTAAVGATVFWLTCPHLNTLVARLEHHGAIQSVAQYLHTHPTAMAEHCASHAQYERRVQALLPPESWTFFDTHFVHPEREDKRKFGNAAVGHAEDMKCLHALVAQAMCGAENPIGLVVLNYMLFLYALLPEEAAAGVEGQPPQSTSSNSVSASADVQAEEAKEGKVCHAPLRAVMDSADTFSTFLEASFETRSAIRVEVPSGSDTQLRHHVWCGVEEIRTLHPDICQRSLAVLVFLEGKPPRANKKHRLN